MSNRRAIAVVSFGTTYVDTAEKTIKAVERDILESFSGYEVVSAYTSGIVRKNLLLEENVLVASPEECLEDLLQRGFTEVTILPTHIIGGEEYSKVVECAEKYSSRFESVRVCRPLIESNDVPKVVDTILEVFNVPDGSFLVFMGHGSNTQANQTYHLINGELASRGVTNVYVATVEATPELMNAVDVVKAYRPKEVILTPFMLVSGDHAHNDMDEGWKAVFQEANFNTRCILKGIGEYPQFRRIYVDRVREVLC